MTHSAAFVMLMACASLVGCAKYEYLIIEPTESAGHLTRQERTIDWEPVIYHIVDQSSRVGIRVENPTGDAMMIVGDESYVVTPDGRSETMRGGTIAPMSWAGLTVPPLFRTFERSGGVSFGFGVGSWSDRGYGGVGVGYSPWDDGFYVPRDEVAWRWKDGVVRMHIVIEQSGETARRVEHDFTIERRKVE